MASNINPNNIDGTYPVAGQDNDSQGFRTNFTNIKNNFIYSKAELEDLQAKVVLKSALTGTSVDNNMAGTVFRSAEIKDLRETRVALGTTSGTLNLDHTVAHYYTVTTNGPVDLTFTGFPPAGKVGRIRLEITIGSITDTITLPANVTYGLQGLAGFDGTDTVEFYTTGTYVFEFISEDGGTNVHIQDLSRARDYFHSSQLILQERASAPLAVGVVGDTAGMIRWNGVYLYICTADYDGSTNIWKRALLEGYS